MTLVELAIQRVPERFDHPPARDFDRQALKARRDVIVVSGVPRRGQSTGRQCLVFTA